MSHSEEVDSRVCFSIDWLVAAVQMLHERHISLGGSAWSLIASRVRGAQDALGVKMVMTGLGMKADWAREEGKLDEALAIFEKLASLVKPDNSRYYLEVAGAIRVLLEKGEQATAFDLMGRSASTAVDTPAMLAWVAFDMLVLARYGDLAESVKTPVFLEALDTYERRFLPDKTLGLADLWRRDPQQALDTLLDHSPHPPPRWSRTRPRKVKVNRADPRRRINDEDSR